MPSFDGLLIVCAVAFAAPIVLGLVPRVRLPSVVLEIVAGIVIGPSVLGIVTADQAVDVIALIGLAFVLFLAGLEIDVHQLRGRLLELAGLGLLLTLVLGLVVGSGFRLVDWVRSPLFLAIALSATSLGLVVPVLKDSGQATTALGQQTIAASSVNDFAAVVLLTLFFRPPPPEPGPRCCS